MLHLPRMELPRRAKSSGRRCGFLTRTAARWRSASKATGSTSAPGNGCMSTTCRARSRRRSSGEGDPEGGGKWRYLPLPPAFPGDANTAVSGIPQSDGRRVVFTNRIRRRAALYDFEDAQHPRLLAAWKFSGNPDLAQFHKGKVVIPCGYQGVLLQIESRQDEGDWPVSARKKMENAEGEP